MLTLISLLSAFGFAALIIRRPVHTGRALRPMLPASHFNYPLLGRASRPVQFRATHTSHTPGHRSVHTDEFQAGRLRHAWPVLCPGKTGGRSGSLGGLVQWTAVQGSERCCNGTATRKRLTQAQLAEKAGRSERAISDLERGLKHPQRATVRLLIDALGLPPELAETFGRSTRAGSAPSTVAAPDTLKHNLPTALTSFVGREDAIARLWRLVDPRASHSPFVHLVTLTGAGGCGKTRLAVEVARRASAEFPDGIWFADLSSVTDSTLVPNILLGSDWRPGGIGPVPSRQPGPSSAHAELLLVLDNCEHLIDACAQLLEAVLTASPHLRVLATSREALRVPGEDVWRVPSLTVPQATQCVDANLVLEYEAVRLFIDRIRQVEMEFALTRSNAASVVAICNWLDGIPLAIELAAARASAMSVQEIAARLDDCFSLLTNGHRTAMMQHRTLRATIDWSHDLLSPTEQTLFRRLAVFAGGWTLEAAEAVGGAEPLELSQIPHLLMRLIDQSLVSVHSADGRTR